MRAIKTETYKEELKSVENRANSAQQQILFVISRYKAIENNQIKTTSDGLLLVQFSRDPVNGVTTYFHARVEMSKLKFKIKITIKSKSAQNAQN